MKTIELSGAEAGPLPHPARSLPANQHGAPRQGEPPGHAPAAPITSASSPLPVGVVGRRAFSGIAWTYRNGLEAVLARVPGNTWLEPEKQPDWIRIKHNGMREVWRAVIDKKLYYLKYYAVRGLLRRFKELVRLPACQAEWRGGLYSLKAGIAAAQPCGFATGLRRGRRRFSLLVTEGVDPAHPLNDYWLSLREERDRRRRRAAVREIIDRVAELIARAHQAGFEHLDMHAANILVSPRPGGEFHPLFVDLHSARLGLPVSDRAAVRNLAQLNQWFRRHATVGDRLRFLRAYLQWRDEYEHGFEHGRRLGLDFEQLVRALALEADVHARRIWAKRDRRVGRDGNYFSRITLGGGWRAVVFRRCKHPQPESPVSARQLEKEWWRRQLADPLRWLEPRIAESCKNSHSASVVRALLPHPAGDIPVILKRPLARNWRRALARRLGRSRSMRAWRTANSLLHRDLPAARPIAVLERRAGPLVLDSMIITEIVPACTDLESAFKRSSPGLAPTPAWKRQLGRLLVAHLRKLFERGFVHRDCKASNILLVESPAPRLIWIDMDGIRFGPDTEDARLHALTRLHVSLIDSPCITTADRVRFVRDFCARFGGDPDAWRTAWRKLASMSAAKLSDKQRRREWKLRHYGRE